MCSPSFTVSLKGGMDIESVSDEDKVTVPVNVFQGLNAYQASEALSSLGLEGKLNSKLSIVFVRLWDMFISTGMLSCEINPWRVTKGGKIYACDFKATFDDSNFKMRDLGIEWPEYPTTETSFETEMNEWNAASHQGQAHVSALGGKRVLPILFGGGASTIIVEMSLSSSKLTSSGAIRSHESTSRPASSRRSPSCCCPMTIPRAARPAPGIPTP